MYVRDTDDWIALSWEARAIFDFVLRKVDRAGVLQTKRGARGVAGMIRMPAEIVEKFLPELLADGCIRECEIGYVLPNFMAAQEASQSDAHRQRESRARRRELAVTSRDRSVTTSVSSVTTSHDESLLPSQPSQPSQRRRGNRSPKAGERPIPPEWTPKEVQAPAKIREGLAPDLRSPISDPDLPSASRRRRKHPLPDGWAPTGITAPLGVNLETELAKFKNHAAANGRVQIDWEASFRNWLISASEHSNGKPIALRRGSPN
jgi:hypothetical protein